MNNITAGTIARTILLILALVNQVLTSLGKPILPFDNELLTEVITGLFTIIASISAWWKNNSFTKEARAADELLATMKEAKKEGGYYGIPDSGSDES